MALWGNKDNISVSAGGTALLSWTPDSNGNFTVTGAGTSFGAVGCAATGDIIRFGQHGPSSTFYGDAVIISIASATSLTIGSTIGLRGADILGVDFSITQAPKYTVIDPSYSESSLINQEAPEWKHIFQGIGATGASVGASNIPAYGAQGGPGSWRELGHDNIKVTDSYLDGSNNIEVAGLGTVYVDAAFASAVGFNTIFFDTSAVPGLQYGDKINPNAYPTGSHQYTVQGIAATYVTLGVGTIHEAIGVGTDLLITGDNIISLATTISNGISTSQALIFEREQSGYDKYVYGIGKTGVDNAAVPGNQYRTSAGWVGVTTYMGVEGEMRVKKEVLVAMSGISTGNAPAYPPGEY